MRDRGKQIDVEPTLLEGHFAQLHDPRIDQARHHRPTPVHLAIPKRDLELAQHLRHLQDAVRIIDLHQQRPTFDTDRHPADRISRAVAAGHENIPSHQKRILDLFGTHGLTFTAGGPNHD